MQLKELTLQHFRNYSQKVFSFSPGTNLIRGKNGAGKTNLLEAIYLLSIGRSFRTPHLTDLIQKGASHFYIEAYFEKDRANQRLSFGFDGKTRKIIHNHTQLPTLSQMLGILPSTLYSPKDMALISGSPADRRRFLNLQLAQVDLFYVHHLMRYYRAMKHRNALLKIKNEATIESFEQVMAHSALYLMERRERLVRSLKNHLGRFALILSNEEDHFDLFYEPSISLKDFQVSEIEKLFQKKRPQELIIGTTIVGPHRDDMVITFDEKEAKIYSSEGQKRTCLSALKIVEWEHIRSHIKEQPLFSIDDFGVHLDENRTETLCKHLGNFGQVFLTTPLKQELPSLESAHILHI
jgi:DNA replication and repair protein RecF